MTGNMKANSELVTPNSPMESSRLRPLDAVPGNLPASLIPLFGRERETATLRQLLVRDDMHLVTITGPGGVGKTSLALRVAYEAQDSYPDGVFFVSLAPISDPTLILPTIAQTLNLPESPRRLWLDSLKDYLRDRQLLLLLDNFEQIMTAAPLLTELVSASAGLRLLITSREALRVRGEQEFLLSPLALPDQPMVETLLQYPSIALFVQRARAAQLEFQLTPQNAAAVAEICERLDGLPLALELAAARIKMFPPQAMLARLQDSPLQLLTHGARDLPERQQTLRRAMQWSYDLLDKEEQRAFRWCSVFVGSSTPEAALGVLGPPTSLDVLESLASQSLLRLIETNDTARLVMLETIREFGWELLIQTAELEAARRAHAVYYASLAEQAERYLVGIDQKTWLRQLEVEQDNLRAALHWAMEQHAGEMAQRMAGALQPFWLTRGRWSEGRHWLEEALALDSGGTLAPAVRAKTLYGAGILARFQGDFARARMVCQSSLTLYRALADNTGVLMALVELSRISSFQGDQTSTESFLAEAASLLETLPDTAVKAYAYSEMAVPIVRPGTIQYPSQAIRYLAESVRINRALNNSAGLALALIRQGSVGLFEDDSALMKSRLDEAEHLAQELGDERILNRLEGIRALADLQAGDFAAARLHMEDTVRQALNRGDHQAASWLPMLAAILHGQGLDVWSARIFGLAEAFARTGQTLAYVTSFEEHFHVEERRAEVRAELGDEAFAREIATGKRLKLDDLPAIPNPPAPAAPTLAATPSASGTSLTAREVEVLRLLAQDLSNPQIAERLVVSRRTVDAHLRSIYDKLDVKSRDAAIRVAKERGLISNP